MRNENELLTEPEFEGELETGSRLGKEKKICFHFFLNLDKNKRSGFKIGGYGFSNE